MQVVQEFLDSIGIFLAKLGINPIYIMLWVCAGYFQKTYLQGLTGIKIPFSAKRILVNEAWKTLILGSLFSFVYAALKRPLNEVHTWVEFCASYVFTTSMYELFIKELANKLILFAQGFFNKKLE
jgi:hypothetical protein